MASKKRTTAGDVVARLSEPTLPESDFLQLVRKFECEDRSAQRIGSSISPKDESIRFRQQPTMYFKSETVDVTVVKGRTTVNCNFFGLLGVNGPLPNHLTEFAQERESHHGDGAFTDFINIFNHRMLSLFYRAWANGEPCIQHDRPGENSFVGYLSALSGVTEDPTRVSDTFPDYAKLYYSGFFSSKIKHPNGLRAIISDYFAVPVEINEFKGEWIPLDKSMQCRLGEVSISSQLGLGAIAGDSHWNCQHKFEIQLGPLKRDVLKSFLPNEDKVKTLISLVRNYLGDEWSWDVRLMMGYDDIPELTLSGDEPLGFSSWVGKPSGNKPVNSDIVFNPMERV